MAGYEDDYHEDDYAQARKRVKAKRSFYGSLASYAVVITMLFFINIFTDPSYFWFLWPALGWGVGLLFQGIKVYGGARLGNDWEDREVEKELARNGRKRRPRAAALPTPRRDLLDETERVRERLKPKALREDYDEDEFV